MRVAIVGAGAVGRSVAQALLDDGHKVLLIERRFDQYRPQLVPGADWMLADACESETVRTAGVDTCDAVMAATGDDKANVVFSLLAKFECGVQRVVARVNNPDNQWMFTEAWGVDVAVSTPNAILAAVEEAVTVGGVVRLMTLRQSSGDLVALTLAEGSPLVGVAVSELRLPHDAALLTIRRAGRVTVPQPQARLSAGDELVLVVSEGTEEQVRAALMTSGEHQ